MTLALALRQALSIVPRAPALIFGDRQWSGLELLALAASLQDAFRALEVRAGDRVAWLVPNHPLGVVIHLAALARGAVGVPLNPLYTPHELAQRLSGARPEALVCLEDVSRALARETLRLLPCSERPRLLVVTDPGLQPELQRALTGQVHLVGESGSAESGSGERWILESVEGEAGACRADPLLELAERPPDAPAVLLYTSGTTGQPKGAALSQAALLHNASYIAREWLGGCVGESPGPRVPGHADPGRSHVALGVLPLCHNFGLNVTIDASLLHGGTLVILPRFSAVEALRAMAAHRVSFLPLVPTMTQALLQSPELERVGVDSLRLLVSGGAALPGVLRARVLERWPALALRDTYGLSEASLVACTRPEVLRSSDLEPQGRPGMAHQDRPGVVGRAVADTRLEVVDEWGQPCRVGEVGEIRVRGPGVMLGYWERLPGQQVDEAPSAMAPLSPLRDGWLYTGDLGRLDADGDLTLVDRKKDLIVRGGYNIYPLEVEEVLYRFPGVAEAVVYGVPDPRFGERVMACVAPVPGTVLEPAAVLAHCRVHLAEFKVPARVEVRAHLPRGSTGKLLRRTLREQASGREGCLVSGD